ncbi:MAG: hybrid sensor histidine kinase/response regulator [Pseudomonadota bacterium]
MDSQESLEVLKDVVITAQEEMHEVIGELATDVVQADEAMSALIGQIDNISMAAQMVDLHGLHCLCNELNDYLSNLDANIDWVTAHGPIVVEWARDIVCYLESPSDISIAEKLLVPLPDQHPNTWLEMLCPGGTNVPGDIQDASPEAITNLNTSGGSDGVVMSTHEPPAMEQETTITKGSPKDPKENNLGPEEISEDAPMGVLIVLGQEFREIQPQLTEYLQIIFTSNANKSVRSAAVDQYGTLLERIIAVSDALEMAGLHQVCESVKFNLAGITTQLDGALYNLFDGWPSLVLEYLTNPNNDNACLALVNYLQHESWPQPLADDAGHDLLEALTAIPTELGMEEHIEARPTEAQPEDVSLAISEDTNTELLNAFFQEAPNHATNFTICIEHLVAGNAIVENIEAAQRLTHTLKGAANLLGTRGVANLAHHLEDILEYLAKHQISPSPALANTLQASADCLATMIDAMQGIDTDPQDSLQILQAVLDWANRIDHGHTKELSVQPNKTKNAWPTQTNSESAPKSLAKDQVISRPQYAKAISNNEALQIPATSMDNLFKLTGETSISIGRIQEHVERMMALSQQLHEQDNTVQQRRFDLENLVSVRSFAGLQRSMRQEVGGQTVFDSLELDQYDGLYEAAHRFIESVADSRELSKRIQDKLAALDGLFAEQHVLNKEMQQRVMAMRMVSISKIVSRLQRSVRQACRATGKQAELNIEGTDLLLDGEVLNRLADPLMHLLRNAIDHGIESPVDRERLGKPLNGALTITFVRDGNHMLIRCKDDGRGLDYQRIREIAIENHLLNNQDDLNDRELSQLILAPGFSTRQHATQISGRGIGMDVVHNTVMGLKGSIDIYSKKGEGCTITLRLPITLITSHALLVRAANELYAIPSNHLDQILLPQSDSFSQTAEEWAFHLDKTLYTVKTLGNLLGLTSPSKEVVKQSNTVLLVRKEFGRVAIVVDQVVGSHELVIKGLGRFVNNIPGIAGVSILGDGNVVAVLDLPELIQKSRGHQDEFTRALRHVNPIQDIDNPSVLIVDDSLSVRQSLAELMKDSGYVFHLAHDGLDAVNQLRKNTPKIVLADLEMPNMNGLELTSHIRANERLKTLPVIMITSRTQHKHHQQALSVGVNAYLNKPYSEDELLETMEQLICESESDDN